MFKDFVLSEIESIKLTKSESRVLNELLDDFRNEFENYGGRLDNEGASRLEGE